MITMIYSKGESEVRYMRPPSICLYVDEETVEAARSLPRNMSASRIMRHLLKAWAYTDEQWGEYARTDECKACREFIRPYKKRIFGNV